MVSIGVSGGHRYCVLDPLMTFSLDQAYPRWQARIKTNALFRYWWQFWSNYSFVLFVAAAVYLYFTTTEALSIGITSLAAFVLARLGTVILINLFVHRERPYQRYGFAPITSRFFSLRTTIHNSFPSRHSAALSAIAMTVCIFAPIVGIPLLIVTLLTGIARVILGYHYPSDIAAGIVIGIINAYAAVLILGILLFT